MSVKELSFDNNYVNIRFINDDTLIIKLDIPCAVASLDRNQAHLLYLYLGSYLCKDKDK